MTLWRVSAKHHQLGHNYNYSTGILDECCSDLVLQSYIIARHLQAWPVHVWNTVMCPMMLSTVNMQQQDHTRLQEQQLHIALVADLNQASSLKGVDVRLQHRQSVQCKCNLLIFREARLAPACNLGWLVEASLAGTDCQALDACATVKLSKRLCTDDRCSFKPAPPLAATPEQSGHV